MFSYPAWHCCSNWITQYGAGCVYFSGEFSSYFTLIRVIACKHDEARSQVVGFLLSASTTTRAWRKLWPPMSPLHRCPWERWVPCPPRYPAPPTQVEVNPQVRAQTPDLAREEPRGSSRPRRPPALRLQLQASSRCCLRKTKTPRWRSKWRVVMNVS